MVFRDNRNLPRRLCSFLSLPSVCCSALWVEASSRDNGPHPPGCDSMLAFSLNESSLSEGSGNIHLRSLSPWSWRSNTVKNRIPSTIWEAECSSSCFSPGPRSTDSKDLDSVPIYQNILVLIRQGAGRCFTATYRSVAVGCTCVRTRTN
uniref:Interleukin-17A-like n=1 Tax=Echeneis naucrates TaxID=173247 RepID=A0A665WUF2_ECHNA